MTGRPKFEEFEVGTSSVGQLVEVARETVEDQKLKSFEDGYNAGWQDAVAAQKDANTFISEHLAQALKDIGLTQREAMEDALSATLGAFSDVVRLFLPSLTAEHIHNIVAEIIQEKKLDLGDLSINLATSAEDFETVSHLLGALDARIHISSTSRLAAGQMELSTGVQDLEIDLREAVQRVLAEVNSLLKSLREETGHD